MHGFLHDFPQKSKQKERPKAHQPVSSYHLLRFCDIVITYNNFQEGKKMEHIIWNREMRMRGIARTRERHPARPPEKKMVEKCYNKRTVLQEKIR